MLKSLGALLVAAALLITAAVSGALFAVWPVTFGDRQLRVDADTLAQLQQLRNEPKFLLHDPSLYPGATSEAVRLAAQAAVDGAIDQLLLALPQRPQRSTVLAAIKLALPSFDHLDSEEQDRAVLYFEQVMNITGVQTSGKLLNVWRYGIPI